MSMFPIASAVITNSTTVSFVFSSIPTNFTHLQLRTFQRVTASGTGISDVYFYLNSDYGTNYTRHALMGDGSSASSNSGTANIGIPFGLAPQTSSTANTFGTSVIDILDNNNANKYKTIRAIHGADLNGSGTVRLQSGFWSNTSTITTIEVSTGTGSYYLAAGTRFDLYGIQTSNATGA